MGRPAIILIGIALIFCGFMAGKTYEHERMLGVPSDTDSVTVDWAIARLEYAAYIHYYYIQNPREGENITFQTNCWQANLKIADLIRELSK